MPAAASLRPRAWAASLLESCSKWRSKMISRSTPSRSSRAIRKRCCNSPRSASAAGVTQDREAGPRGRAKIGRLTLLNPHSMRGVARDRGSVCQPRGACGGHRSRGHERSAAARGETAGPGYAGIHPASGWLSGARPGRCRWHRPAGPAPGPAAVRSSAGGQGGDAPRVRPRRKGRPAQLASKAAWFQSHLATSVNPCPGLVCPVWIAPRIPPWRVRPTGDPNRFVSIPAGTHGRPSFPMGTPIPDFFTTPGNLVNVPAHSAVLVVRSTDAPETNVPWRSLPCTPCPLTSPTCSSASR